MDQISMSDASLPSLDPGVTLLDTGQNAMAALQTLVLDHVLLANDTNVLWVDARNNAATYKLLQVAPSRRTLDRINVARAFTAFQHYSLVQHLVAAYHDGISLLVLPAIDWFYSSDDLWRNEGDTMLSAALEIVTELADACDVPVLLTRHQRDGVGQRVDEYVDHDLACEYTKFGPRFTGEEFETLLYQGDGFIQTTLAYWRRVLAQRHPTAYDVATQTDKEVTALGPY